MARVRDAADEPNQPDAVFIHQASVEDGELFFAERAPGARAVADPEGVLFDAFGLRRGSLLELLGPSVWWRGLRALSRGHFVGKPAGDTLRMPGAFLVRGRRILWSHRARHAGDQPDLAAVSNALRAATAREAG